jgi:peroxiredoxin
MNTLRKLLIIVSLSGPLLGTAQGKFTIHGQVTGPLEGKVTLNRYTLEKGQSKDTAVVVDGGFTFTGKMYTHDPEIGQIVANDGKRNLQSIVFYLEPGTINVHPAVGRRGKAVGTPLNDDFQEYNDMLYSFLDTFKVNVGMGPVYHRFDTKIQDNVVAITDKFVKKHSASMVSLDVIKDMITYTKDLSKANQSKLNVLFQRLSPVIKNSEKGKELSMKLKGLNFAGPGEMAPLFSMSDTSGRVVSLAGFRGKYVLLDFWATWCIPCIAEMPNVFSAWNTYKNKNFTVVGVSLDRPDSKQRWLKMIRESKYNWTQLSDLKFWNSEAALLYNVNSVPANFLIDPSGIIIATNLRGEALQKKLSEILQ